MTLKISNVNTTKFKICRVLIDELKMGFLFICSIFFLFLDEEKLFGIEENTEDVDVYVTQEYLIWEEFANVATNLLEKIEYFLDTFDQINLESVNEDQVNNKKDSSTNLSFAAW